MTHLPDRGNPLDFATLLWRCPPSDAHAAMSKNDNGSAPSPDLRWWQRTVVYQIAPMSFQDSDGDGKGDIEGIMQRLSHLEWLGVDAVWLCPIYRSSMLDFGYDIIDYCDVDPLFGNLADFDRMLAAMHERGIKVLLDFVPNHTSSEHPWFLESRASRQNPRRDWYIWADPDMDGRPPNNWLSRFGDSAWTLDEGTGQYYYHAFLKEQPDLNWRNPQVRRAMADVLRFWLRRGVDGFRVDASAVLIEDDLLRDDPPDPGYDPESTPPPQRLRRIFTDDRPECMHCLEDLRAVLDEFPDRVLAGEVQGKIGRIGHFYGNDKPRLHLPLNFALLDTAWDALSVQGTIDAYLKAIPDDAWPDWVVGGHDKPRVASRIGQAQARILAMLLLTLRGTPFFFAGDEIGMTDVTIPPQCVQDVFEQRVPGYGLNRDPERSPMRWNGSANGAFTCGRPWLPMGHDVEERNVARLQRDRRSLLWLYRSLIRIRKEEKALTAGRYVPLRSRNDVFMFKRAYGGSEFLVALNFSHDPRRLPLDVAGDLVLSTYLDRDAGAIAAPLVLRGDEGVLLRVRQP